MTQSSFGSQEVGMSRGMVSTTSVLIAELALAVGARTGLKKNPVKLVKKKSAMIANGANFTERQWGTIRANFISRFLHVSDDPTGHQNLVPLTRDFCATHGGTDCKELEIETADKMEIVL